MRNKLLTLAVLVSTPWVARADERSVDRDLRMAAQAIIRLAADLELPATITVERCREAIKEGREEGIPASFELTSSAGYTGLPNAYPDPDSNGESHMRFGDAAAVCDKLAEWMVLGKARKAIDEAAYAIEWLKMIDMTTNHEENGAKLMATAKACSEAILTLTNAKYTTIKVARYGRTDHYTVAVTDIDTKYCAPLGKVADTFAADVKEARRKEWERLAAPYKAAGLKGDGSTSSCRCRGARSTARAAASSPRPRRRRRRR